MRNTIKRLPLCLLLLLTGCTPTDAVSVTQPPPDLPAQTAVRETADAPIHTTATEQVTARNTETTTATATAVAEETTEAANPETTAPATDPPAPEETAAEEATPDIPVQTEPVYETFVGILIDEDCSDFEDPPLHDLPCMLMDSCRASGYGLDIQQPDGSWLFYPFDETGQALSWDYLIHTERMDGLYVKVTGTWEGNCIKVIAIEEI